MMRELRAARRVYRMIAALHRRGYERLRIVPGRSPSGRYERSCVTSADNVFTDRGAHAVDWDRVAINTSANGSRLFGWHDAPNMSIATLARRFVERFPEIAERGLGPDPDYVRWFALALERMERGISHRADGAVPRSRRRRPDTTNRCDEASPVPVPPPGTHARRYDVMRREDERESCERDAPEFRSPERRHGCHTCDARPSYDAGVDDETSTNDALRLDALLEEAGYPTTRRDATRRLITFAGRTRDWTFSVGFANGWFSIGSYVCERPEIVALRADLFEVAMSANHAMSLTKFVNANGLIFELEYRDAHLDADVLRDLIGLALANLEEWYPRIFRVVSGDKALASITTSPMPSIDPW